MAVSHALSHHAVGFAARKQCSGLSPPAWGLQTIARITSHARLANTLDILNMSGVKKYTDGLCFEPGVSLKTGDPACPAETRRVVMKTITRKKAERKAVKVLRTEYRVV
ncbi:hypothetical protein TESG_05050 [Trichophyton tonsurans CBS 112818]|uniref:Uncharacterized protein n=2 Tax=Trichophyton TaxID=5550 RepID=F2PSJ6_TRIEC|nr:hypothetical protein TESG_05050 [Trichophyton tonsurans CBS 112818]EGE04775.1 hypothetical protein TEQG_03948 [Trichophyton equinum CBS 127.97]